MKNFWVQKSRFLILPGLGLLLLLTLAACGEATATPAPAVATQAATPTQANKANILTTAGAVNSPPAAATSVAAPASSAAVPASTPVAATATPAVNTGVSGGGSAAGQATLSVAPAIISTTAGQTVNMKLELARTYQEQEIGLMGRTSLPEDGGMLFIFPTKVQTGFWMKNTLIPLSIAWIDEKGVFLEIQDMEAQSEAVHTPSKPYVWALEVPKGYFSNKGIQAGSTIKLQTP